MIRLMATAFGTLVGLCLAAFCVAGGILREEARIKAARRRAAADSVEPAVADATRLVLSRRARPRPAEEFWAESERMAFALVARHAAARRPDTVWTGAALAARAAELILGAAEPTPTSAEVDAALRALAEAYPFPDTLRAALAGLRPTACAYLDRIRDAEGAR